MKLNSWLKLALLLCCVNLVSCLEAQVHSPEDMISEMCQAGSYNGTIIRCVNSNGTLQSRLKTEIKTESRALFVFAEPGDYASNAALGDETVRAIAQNVPSMFRPLLRQVMINLVVGHQKMLMDTQGKKYDVIYYARSNQYWNASGFVTGLENVIRNHTTVDLFLLVHGGRSNISLNPNLQTKVTDVDLDTLNHRLSTEARSRVRAIFLTACYAAEKNYLSSHSITSKLVSIFPKAMTYGSKGVNYGPIHRDMMAFEFYYKNWMFTSAVSLGNQVLTKNIRNGQERTQLDMPVFSVRGQGRYFGIQKTKREIIKITPLRLNSYVINLSKAEFFYNKKWDAKITTINENSATDAAAPVY
jgi:hypothetical protein